MKLKNLILPGTALAAASAMLVPVELTEAYTIIHSGIGLGQRDFRVWNNFSDGTANNNNVPHANFPGATGAVMALWKGTIEWQSELHGDGNGDPSQPNGLGSGGANFDSTFQGLHTSAGGLNDNVISEVGSCQNGVLAYTEDANSNGWRIRFCAGITWDDGPSTAIGTRFDIQGVQCHEYGHALGLGHSTTSSATMYFAIGNGQTHTRSIANDDINGVKAVYGNMSGGKPSIDSICIAGNQMTITGTNFQPTSNTIWLTNANFNNGTAVKVFNQTSNGTDITFTIPGNAGPGDVLVQSGGGGNANLSNAWPTDLQTTGGNCAGSCPSPVNYCSTAPNSVGPGMTISSFGTTSVAAEDFGLTSFGGPPTNLGIYYYGSNQTQVPFGEGFRCVDPGILGTFRLPVIQINGFGDATYSLDWGSVPVGSGNGQILAGSVWNFQFWYRDPLGGGTGFNLSDATTVTFCP